ncbi:MAG: L,D-transpeptidase family protein [Bacteroidetes bacterium]|nr:L,D-transpeptidase family protein [Bacteroidota bacterium]MBT6686453.1 L,D-transpeptidase family protein [Bacteroidota bacterium]MBT7144692.1 L,D-transpeptidase family protein [Bacteroidota bacterium]MBT7491272.1 L,D-transpeptidase family protein [Bacteroidota bacterium]
MKKIIIIFCITLIYTTILAQDDFLSEQKRYKRVRSAIAEKGQLVINKLQATNIEIAELNIIILAFKAESIIEIYAKKNNEKTYRKLTTYKICAKSGNLGPKRKQGDFQVPEGFYCINRFNPYSNFHLSLGINYPNLADRRKSNFSNLGGDIFIHGSCVTIGCLPMSDDKIKEIYLYAINAKNNGQQKIPVYIFPFKMTQQKYLENLEKNKNNPELNVFWTNIKDGYDKFENEKTELKISVSSKGDYIFR